MTMTWGIVARSRSTGIQIRKPLAEPYSDPAAASDAAVAWTEELNQEQKFGLNDWVARYDHVEGGPGEDNVNPAEAVHPAHAQPNTPMGQNMANYTGMNGRL
jgi:hypothetical protein